MFQLPPGFCGCGHICPEADAQLAGQRHLVQGFAVGRKVGLAVVGSLPTTIGGPGFPHIEKQGIAEVCWPVHDQIHRWAVMGTARPAPETQGQGRELQGIELVWADLLHRGGTSAQTSAEIIGEICCEQGVLPGVCLFTAEQRSLMLMQPLLPVFEKLSAQRQVPGLVEANVEGLIRKQLPLACGSVHPLSSGVAAWGLPNGPRS